MQTFRFKTRLQRLNSIEASSRAKINFLEQLYRFHKQQGNPRIAVPTINHKPLDLWLLRKEVHKLGGFDAVCDCALLMSLIAYVLCQVTRNKHWADLGRILGYKGIPGLSTQLRNSYTRIILPYEHFCEHVRNSPALSPMKPGADPAQVRLSINAQIKAALSAQDTSGSAEGKGDVSGPSSPQSRSSSPLSEPPDESERRKNGDDGRARRRRRHDSLKGEFRPDWPLTCCD